jgi:hypothetical protein
MTSFKKIIYKTEIINRSNQLTILGKGFEKIFPYLKYMLNRQEGNNKQKLEGEPHYGRGIYMCTTLLGLFTSHLKLCICAEPNPHFPQANRHVLTFLHPILLCRIVQIRAPLEMFLSSLSLCRFFVNFVIFSKN